MTNGRNPLPSDRSMRPKPNPSRRPLTTPSRVLALLLAWLVFGLSLVSSSPEAHAFVHRAEQPPAADCDHAHSEPPESPDHVCAVVLFAGGIDLPVADYLPLPAETVAAVPEAGRTDLLLAPPSYLRQPERGPPSA